MKIALFGNVTLDFLAQDFRRQGHEVYLPPGFDTWRQEMLDPASGAHAFRPDAILLVLCDAKVPRDSTDLKDLEASFPGARIVAPDLAALAAETPGFHDERMCRLAAMPFSLAGLRAIEDEFLFAVDAAPKKILALDADGTLWDGIVSEDGPADVDPYIDFQQGVLALKRDGIVLVLLSKNDPLPEGVIAEVFARDDVPLSLDDFAATGVDWSPKAGNLLQICRDLNLGTDSVVFVDDNPHERAQMKAHLPEVVVPPFPAEMRLTHPAAFLRRLRTCFFPAAQTDEDRARAEMYRAESARRAFAATRPTLQDYLKGLSLRATPARATTDDIPRLAQMAGKTNQFNATTLRRSADDFAALLADASKRVWTFRAADAFGEMGLVCYVVYDASSGRITDFVMSCRAMGRTLEHYALNHVRRELAAEGLSLAGIDFAPTAKNAPFRAFLDAVDLSRELTTYYA